MYLKLCYDIYARIPGPHTMPYACYNGRTSEIIPGMSAHLESISSFLQPFRDLKGIICFNAHIRWECLGMLLMLQLLNIVWFGMILKVIGGILTGGKPEDVRSDDEEGIVGEENFEVTVGKRITDLSICVGPAVEADSERKLLTGPAREHALQSPRATITTRMGGLKNAENRKKLLSRIGCDEPV